jgi:TonB family protein
MTNVRHIVLALMLALLGGCASRQPEYHSSNDSTRRSREDAEKAYALSLVPLKVPKSLKLDKPLKAIYTPFPDYPRELANARVTGNVRTKFTIGEDGKVSSPTVIGSPPPALASIALQSILRWQFEPPMAAGEPTRIEAVQEFVFQLE